MHQVVESSLRSFNSLFLGLSMEQRFRVFSETGLKHTFTKDEEPLIDPSSTFGIDLLGDAMKKSPTVLVEAMVIVPYISRELTKLDAYNAVGQISNISNYALYSSTQKKDIPLFNFTTRLDRGKRDRPIPDPPPASVLPSSETIYLCLRDTYFGNTYFRGDYSEKQYGITYNLTNNLAVWFLVFPVMRAEKFVTILYIEPLAEGMLIYGIAGVDIPEFLASRINLAYQIDRRVTIFINWLKDGLRSMN